MALTAKPGQPMISLQHIQKKFDGKTVINDLNLQIKQGEFFVLVGTSGSGKTTTLKMINRLEEQDDGDILIESKKVKDFDLQDLRWNMGYVLQQIALFPTMTVAQNIGLIPEMKGWNKQKVAATVDRLLTEVGLDPENYRSRMPSELSGGEQQRIGICRAIASEPPVVLMDEPFSALDPISRNQLQDLVLMLHRRLHDTVVFVTHDMNEALKLGDRIAVMSKGEILQVDTPAKIAQNPANEFVKEFFAHSNTELNLFETPLTELVKLGFYQKSSASEQLATFDQATPLTAVMDQLSREKAISITQNNRAIGTLTAQNIVAFLKNSC
ncbi:ABC transporter ATP-binding protein [Loigolactobacillus iwatensis]|uniref:ABC transporter ATP-binding protein n=1 Tax=Loigolactobacillus iwatensis TaxID=1267156 RepID=UPI002989ED22|nr:ABC transporter ATP-binding protein [Loigolactobacillus iwatensis]